MLTALDDQSRDVGCRAIRIAERWLGEPNSPVTAAVLKRLDDREWPVRHSCGFTRVWPARARDRAVVTLLDRGGDDPIALDAALSGLRGSEQAVLERLLNWRVARRRSAKLP